MHVLASFVESEEVDRSEILTFIAQYDHAADFEVVQIGGQAENARFPEADGEGCAEGAQVASGGNFPSEKECFKL